MFPLSTLSALETMHKQGCLWLVHTEAMSCVTCIRIRTFFNWQQLLLLAAGACKNSGGDFRELIFNSACID
jgi:hypothetical protein